MSRTEKKCQACGKQSGTKGAFCPWCGDKYAITPPPTSTPVQAPTAFTQPVYLADPDEDKEEKGGKKKMNIILKALGAILLILAILFLVLFGFRGCQKTFPSTPTPTPTIAAAATPTPTVNTIVNGPLDTKEALVGTLDEFGSKIQYTDRFAVAGTILDESLFEGQIIVGNAYSVHDNGFVSQKGNVVFYYIAPKGGGRVRITGFDGQFFVINSNVMTLNQAIAAMRDTLIRAHGATVNNVQFHELIRYGDPVK